MNSQYYSGTQQDTGANSLKGKLNSLEVIFSPQLPQGFIKGISEDINFHKKEVQMLRGEKESLENVLALKAQEVRKTLTNEATRYE